MSNVSKKHFSANDTYNLYATAQTNAVVYTPSSGHALRLQGYIITSDTALIITLKTGTTTILRLYVGANSGANLASDNPIAYGGVDQTLNITTSATGNVTVSAWGYED